MIDFERAKGKPPVQTDLDEIFTEYAELAETLDVEALLIELGIDVDMSESDEWVASCPLPSHGGVDANPSFAVSPAKKLFNCFGCGGGSLLSLVKEIEDGSWEESLEVIRSFSDSGDNNDRFAEVIAGLLDRPREKFPDRHPDMPWYASRIMNDLRYNEHVAARHIDEATAASLGIGWRSSHRYREFVGSAIIVPHYWRKQLVGWQARWTEAELPEGVRKNTNSHDLPKGATLYNYDNALLSGRPVAVVESPLTAARIVTADDAFTAVATFGASVSAVQIELLRRFPRVLAAFDNDTAGRKATLKLQHGLDEFVNLYIAEPVGVYDSGDDLGDEADPAVVSDILNGAVAY